MYRPSDRERLAEARQENASREHRSAGSGRRGMRDPRFHEANPLESSIGASRLIILLAIIGTSLSAVTMMVYGLIAVAKIIWHAFAHSDFDIDGAKHLAVELIEMTDLFLLGMVLYVVAVGMYQLFINPEINIPSWMRVDSLDDLKTQLINVIAVLLAVSFLAVAVSWTSDRSILYFGIAIAVVILSLAGYSLAHHRIAHGGDHDEDEA
ncbi:MAG: YqhA family protein [Thermomicrobiales bacterium]